jgi:tetratricopeptide (TPR) repeat protein
VVTGPFSDDNVGKVCPSGSRWRQFVRGENRPLSGMSVVDSPRNIRIALLLLGALFLVQFGRTLSYGLVWDDTVFQGSFYQQPLGRLLRSTQQEQLDAVLLETRGFHVPFDSYRPLASLSYWFDIQIAGPHAAVFHAHNVLLGLLNLFLGFATARRLFRLGNWHAVLCAAFFGLHPLQIEAVSYVAARSDLLAGTFTLLSALAACASADAQKVRDRWGFATVSALALAASLLTKEAALGIPLALLAIGFVQGRPRAFAATAAVQTAAIGVWLFLRALLLHSADGLNGESPMAMILAIPAVLAGYVEALLLPTDLSIERPFHTGWVPWCLALAVILAAALFLARKRQGPGGAAAQASSGLCWSGALLATSPFGVYSFHVLSDRYVYASLLGLIVACSALLGEISHHRPRLTPFILGLSLLWTTALLPIAVRQVRTWRDDTALYAHALGMQPDSSMANYHVGTVLAQDQRWEQALPFFSRAAALDPYNVFALNNQGVTLLNLGRWADAIQTLKRAVALTGGLNYRAIFNIGVAHDGAGRIEQACKAYARANKVNPVYEPAKLAFRDRCASSPGPAAP